MSDGLTHPVRVVKHVRGIFNQLGLEPEPTEHRRVLAAVTYLRNA